MDKELKNIIVSCLLLDTNFKDGLLIELIKMINLDCETIDKAEIAFYDRAIEINKAENRRVKRFFQWLRETI